MGADVLLGMSAPRPVKKVAASRLERCLIEIEKLDARAKRQITQILDTFLEKSQAARTRSGHKPHDHARTDA